MDLSEYQRIHTEDVDIDYFYLDDNQKIELLNAFEIERKLESIDEFTNAFLLKNGWVVSVIGSLQSKKGFGLYLNLSLKDYEKGVSSEQESETNLVEKEKKKLEPRRVLNQQT